MDRSEKIILFSSTLWAFLLLTMCTVAEINGDIHGYEFNTGIFCALFCFVPSIFYRFRIMKLPVWMALLIHLAIFLHATGVLFFAYDVLIYYDNVTHTFSSFVVSMCVMLTLFSLQRYNGGIRFTVGVYSVFVVLVMTSFGVIWEEFEYVVDITTGTKMQYCPLDTLRDMICNTLGSVLCAVFMYRYMRHRSVDELIDSIELHPYLRAFLGEKKRE